jgi:methionine synthase II (cobalamin-independent)
MATLIGSLPYTDPQEAVRLVLEHLFEAPIWPELPRRAFLEGMVHSHTQGLPGLVVDPEAEKLYVDTEKDCSEELAAFYESALAAEQGGDLSTFAVAPTHASALEVAAGAMQGRQFPCVKTHCIGPVSFGLQLTDGQGKSLFYDETFQDVLARQVALQSRWMIRRFAPFAKTVIAFLDEPSLAAFGSSSYIAVSRDLVIEQLSRAIAALKAEGAAVGVHVCGNTDWPMIIAAGADILNYDAYEYGQSLLLYPGEVDSLLRRGGVLAWGIVPNSGKVRRETAASLRRRFFSLVDDLASRGLDRELILNQSMLTPACGLGSMPAGDARKAIGLLCELAKSVQEQVRA